MDRDARRMRGERPFVFTNLKTGHGLQQVIDFILERGMLTARLTAPAGALHVLPQRPGSPLPA